MVAEVPVHRELQLTLNTLGAEPGGAGAGDEEEGLLNVIDAVEVPLLLDPSLAVAFTV